MASVAEIAPIGTWSRPWSFHL